MAGMKNALATLLAGSLLSSHVADLSALPAGEKWLRLIPAGTFSGRDGRGPYDAGDRASLEQIAEMTRRFAGAMDIVVDYEHQTLEAANNGRPAPAAGWIKQVEARDDGLYGLIEWTAPAAQAIAAKEYRYLSPVYFHDKAGKVLLLQHVALTNTPNLDLPEVSAHSVRFQPQEVPMKQVLAALGLAEGASEAEALTAVNSLIADRKAIAAAAGLTADAATSVIVSAMKAGGSGNPDPAQYVPIAAVSAMQADLKALQDQIGADKAEEAVNAAIRDGRLVPAMKEWGLAYHRKDPAGFADFIGKAPVLTAAQRASAAPPEKKEGELDAHHSAVAAAMGVDPAAYAKTLAAEEAEKEND